MLFYGTLYVRPTPIISNNNIDCFSSDNNIESIHKSFFEGGSYPLHQLPVVTATSVGASQQQQSVMAGVHSGLFT
jgi:hypothetical protein